MERRIERQYLYVDGVKVDGGNYRDIEKRLSDEERTTYHKLFGFLDDWYSDAPTLTVETSGSTGKPQRISVSKHRMIASAEVTCRYLDLHRGDTALLCMDLKYIGAKMMVVRALAAGLNLIVTVPSAHPLSMISTQISFGSMVPLQVYRSLSVQEEREKLMAMKVLIIGGGKINQALENELKDFPNPVYVTYGMTETLSHVAMRRVNGDSASPKYYPLPSVEITRSEQGRVIIHAPNIGVDNLVTNDLCKMDDDGGFVVVGRVDNVINSGCVKISPEEIEAMMEGLVTEPFALTSVADAVLGEALVMLVEGGDDYRAKYDRLLHQLLPKYSAPKHYLSLPRLPMAGNGKLNRMACKEVAAKMLKP
ncbi:MAG: AMP-binding protein [Porphyromonas sp.]|nr:AMP-binding protein [Porphyromonas sp.]